jgi:hypothetical protein
MSTPAPSQAELARNSISFVRKLHGDVNSSQSSISENDFRTLLNGLTLAADAEKTTLYVLNKPTTQNALRAVIPTNIQTQSLISTGAVLGEALKTVAARGLPEYEPLFSAYKAGQLTENTFKKFSSNNGNPTVLDAQEIVGK